MNALTKIFWSIALLAGGYSLASLLGPPDHDEDLLSRRPATPVSLSGTNQPAPCRGWVPDRPLRLQTPATDERAGWRQTRATSLPDSVTSPTPELTAAQPDAPLPESPQWIRPATVDSSAPLPDVQRLAAEQPPGALGSERWAHLEQQGMRALNWSGDSEEPDELAHDCPRPLPQITASELKLLPCEPSPGGDAVERAGTRADDSLAAAPERPPRLAARDASPMSVAESASASSDRWPVAGGDPDPSTARPVYETVSDQAPVGLSAPAASPWGESAVPANAAVITASPVAEGPAEPGPVHIVADGDTLNKLAERYLDDRNRAWEIYQLNRDHLTHPNLLPIGIHLQIPAASPPAEESPEPPPPAAVPHHTFQTSWAQNGPLIPVKPVPRSSRHGPQAHLLRPVPVDARPP